MGATLFKYCTPGGVAILETLKIEAARPNDLNDPFEVSPRFRDDFTADDFVRRCSDPHYVAAEHARMERGGAPKIAKDFFAFMTSEQVPASMKETLAAHFAEGLANDVQTEVARTQETWSKDIGLICLSKVCDSVLMWSHYADDHRGIVIALDARKIGVRFDDVYYEPKRYEVLTSHYLEDATDEEVNGYFLHKSPDWLYEEEVRGACLLNQLSPIDLGGGKEGFGLPIPASAIVSVKLGARCTIGERVREALANSKIDCPLEQAFPDPEEYKIRFRSA